MNLELLKKLLKLANNNPNENEANSAARRVCKMIEEDNYNLVGGDDIRRRPIQAPQQATTWNDIQRSNESWSWKPYSNPFNDIFGGAAGGGKTASQQYQQKVYEEYIKQQQDITSKSKLIPCPKCGNRKWNKNFYGNNWFCAKCNYVMYDEEFHNYKP